MAGHGCWLIQFIATNIMESSSSWSKNMRSNQRCHASSDMNYTRPSEIYHPNPVNKEKQMMRSVSSIITYNKSKKVMHVSPPKRRSVTGTKKAIVAPDTMYYHWVDKRRERNGVSEVGSHLTTLGKCPCHDGCRSGCESKLKEPEPLVLHIH